MDVNSWRCHHNMTVGFVKMGDLLQSMAIWMGNMRINHPIWGVSPSFSDKGSWVGGHQALFSSHISCSLTDPCEDLLALHGRHWVFANMLECPVDAGRISVFSARNTRLRSHPQSEVYCWVMSGILLFASSCDDGLLLGFPHPLPFCRICSTIEL